MNPISADGLWIPTVTTDQMREVDRLMIAKYGIHLIQMMENAGGNLARLVRNILGDSVKDKGVLVASGKGNNGGGSMVAARHLSNWGAKVTVLLPQKSLKDVPKTQLNILEKLPIKLIFGDDTINHLQKWKGEVVIDGLIGYGLSGAPRGWIGEIIKSINTLEIPVVALDVPSGLDATLGRIYDPCIKAEATMTLALPKDGLLKPEVKSVIGELYVADISVPDVLYNEMGISVGPIFLHDTIIKMDAIKGGTTI